MMVTMLVMTMVTIVTSNDDYDSGDDNGDDGDNIIQSPALMIDLAPTLLHIAGLEDQGIEVFVINHYQTL